MADSEQGRPAALVLRSVSKQYGARTAVADLNLTVAAGEVLGLLGPNGAGKTTTIRMLTGFLRPTRGHISMLGYDLAEPAAAIAARADLGFIPDVAGLDLGDTGIRLLDDLARLQRRPPVDREQVRVALELDPHELRRPLGQLSRGTRQKINVIQGLQHRPALLILDEPTEALDPLGKAALFELLRDAQRRGATIIFSSHVLSEVEALCDRVALIRQGRLVALDRVDNLRRTLHRRVSLQVATADVERVGKVLATLAGVANLGRDGDRWEFTCGELSGLLHELPGWSVVDLRIEPSSLADVFLQYYRSPASARG